MATCPTCGRWLVRRDLVAGRDDPDGPRDRCPYDGAVADMEAPVPADGGPLIGITQTPSPPLTRRETAEVTALLGCCLFEALSRRGLAAHDPA
jgi:hypothetical protein